MVAAALKKYSKIKLYLKISTFAFLRTLLLPWKLKTKNLISGSNGMVRVIITKIVSISLGILTIVLRMNWINSWRNINIGWNWKIKNNSAKKSKNVR